MASAMIPPQVLLSMANTWTQEQTYQSTYGITINNPNGPSLGSTNLSQQGNADLFNICRISGGSVQVFGTNGGQPCGGINLFSNALQARSNGVQLELLDIAYAPASSQPSMTSGAVYQNTTGRYCTLYIPITYNPTSTVAATAVVSLGTSSAPQNIFTNSEPAAAVAGKVATSTLHVPPGWYYEVVVTNATIGTVTQVLE